MPVVALCAPVFLAQGRMLPLGRGLVELLQGEEAKSAVLHYIKKKWFISFFFSFLNFFYILSNPGKKKFNDGSAGSVKLLVFFHQSDPLTPSPLLTSFTDLSSEL